MNVADSDYASDRRDLPPFWQGVMQVVSVGRAAVAGAGAGLAMLGLYVLISIGVGFEPFAEDAPALQWGAGVGAGLAIVLQVLALWTSSRS